MDLIIKKKALTIVIQLFVMSFIMFFYNKLFGHFFPSSYINSAIISLFFFFIILLTDLFFIQKNNIFLDSKRIAIYMGLIALFYLIGGNISTVLMFFIAFKKNFVAHILLCYLSGFIISRCIMIFLNWSKN
jgi:hypothetical protein